MGGGGGGWFRRFESGPRETGDKRDTWPLVDGRRGRTESFLSPNAIHGRSSIDQSDLLARLSITARRRSQSR
jgi:hypothetical protein